ncbi:MAG: Asp-tRNA(Asn)/Glu-tRNA(Gln) amidotransferase subunit GatC [Thermodesulfobacteriota bacterium]|nr:Asp-tRNA(Asn)/Glu-tRNA(Gln) amidotransferase subunit GatC [Thermodesulfobacteriota bacterium]
MKISREDVQHVAKLARLSFSKEDIELFTNQLNQILTYMDKLNELDTAHVELTHHALAITNAFREDAIRPSVSNEKSLANAPAKANGSFTVPRII